MSTTLNPPYQETINTHHDWYCSETGIYHSKHPFVPLPLNPLLDVVTFIFSEHHNGVSALIDSSSGFTISYSDLYPLVKSMAAGLQNMGISKGDVVLILLPNSIFFPVIFLGVLYLGAVVTTMNPLSSFTEIKKQTVECNVCLAFTISENVKKLDELGISSIRVPEHALFDIKDVDFLSFYQLISNKFDSVSKPVINHQDHAAILYSSGTTGSSKGVVLTHGNFIAMVELFVRFEASQYNYSCLNNVYLAVLPLFHIYGLSLFVMGLLSLGSTVVVMKKFSISEVVEAIDGFGVTHFPVVPPILLALTMKAKAGIAVNCMKSLKQVSSGAAPISRKVIDEFIHAFPNVDFIQGYGLTESTAVGTRGYNNTEHRKSSSVGLLAPNMEAKVVSWVTGGSLPPRTCGELWLRGPPIMKGYLNAMDTTTSIIDTDGWLHTGDIVYFDEDGYLYIIDRLKEMIKYKGFQIAPVDLEAVLISHPEIIDAAVTAAKDDKAGEVPVAFVVRRRASMLSQSQVIDFVTGQVAPYKKVRKVLFVDSIPKSPAGKILRRELRKHLTCKL